MSEEKYLEIIRQHINSLSERLAHTIYETEKLRIQRIIEELVRDASTLNGTIRLVQTTLTPEEILTKILEEWRRIFGQN